MEPRILLNKIVDRQNLSLLESMELMEEMLRGKLTLVQISSILTALRMKGETVDEILGFITVMRKYMVKIKTSGLVIDTCGTGGDGKGTFNISTAVALVAAGAGVKVAKHGNRAAGSQCGSADVLEALGVTMNLSPEQAEKMLEKTGFAFLFAPLYHPAMKYAALVRKDLKIRTVFNFLGPFVSPASVKRQIIGVPSLELAKKLAQVATKLNYEHLMIISSDDDLDEISLSAPTSVFEIRKGKIKESKINPKDYGFKKYSKDELKGGDAQINAEIIKSILDGINGAKRDIVLLNTAAALLVAGRTKDLKEGLLIAKKSINDGKAKEVLKKVINYSLMV